MNNQGRIFTKYIRKMKQNAIRIFIQPEEELRNIIEK